MKKKLTMVGGPMGVGKTTVCQQLKELLPRSVLLDGDWCWDMSPFVVNDETKCMVLQNIAYLLQNFLSCSVFEHVIFCWVMPQQESMEDILSRLSLESVELRCVSLVCSEEALREHLQGDVDRGVREKSVIARALSYLPLYEKQNTVKIDVGGCSVQETAQRIADLWEF